MQSKLGRRLTELERRAVRHRAYRDDPAERLDGRLDAIGRRLQASDIVIEIDADELAQRMALVRADIERSREQY